MEKFTGIQVNLGDFILKKIKIGKDKIATVSFKLVKKDGIEIDTIYDGSLTPNYRTNEVLQKAIDTTKEALCKICNKKQDTYKDINVIAVELCGKEDDRTFKLYGVEKAANEQYQPFATSKVHFNAGHYDFLSEIRDITDDIEMLAYKYLFEQEKDQLTLGLKTAPSDDDEPDEEEEE